MDVDSNDHDDDLNDDHDDDFYHDDYENLSFGRLYQRI